MNTPKLLSLLYIFSCKYQEIELIKSLSEHFNFDHHFFIIDSAADTSRYVNTEVFAAQTFYILQNVNNDTELGKVNEIDSKNAFLIVVLESLRFVPNSNLLRQMKAIQRLQIRMKIGVFLSRHSTMVDLRAFFGWCKDNLIVNIFAVTLASSEAIQMSFTFDAFGQFEVVKM